MSSRILISMCCLGAVAFACGPHARKETSTSATQDPVVVQAGEVHAAKPVLSHATRSHVDGPIVTGQLYVRAKDSSVRLALHVVNNSKKRVELTFPSGQTYDFVVLDSVGRELWRWGSGRMFTQALRNTLLGGGETLDYEETWNTAPLAPGHYTARAVLASENFPVMQQVAFTITGTTVASR
jgi:Intracellular proteinase inhibitor